MECPCREWFVPVDGCKPEESVPRADELRALVAKNIDQLRRLVRHPVEDLVLLPVGIESIGFRIFINIRRRTREPDHEDVVPAVAVKVVQPGEQMVGVKVGVLRYRIVDFVFRFVLRPCEPVWTINNVSYVVAIHVDRAGTF